MLDKDFEYSQSAEAVDLAKYFVISPKRAARGGWRKTRDKRGRGEGSAREGTKTKAYEHQTGLYNSHAG